MSKNAKIRAYYVLILIFILYMFDYGDRLVITSFLDSIKHDWHVSDTQLGMLTGIVNLFVALFVLPMSILVDRWSRKKMIAIMALLWSFASLACAFAMNYEQLLAFRALTGLGEAAYASAAVALISKSFPRNNRAQHIGIYNAAAPLGAGLGIMIGGQIAVTLGWRYSFGLVALPGMVLALLFFTIRDYQTLPLDEEKDTKESSFSGLFRSIKNILKIRTLWFVYLAYAIIIGVNTAMLDWSTVYFTRYQGLGQKLASTISGGIAILILVGAPLGGIIGDRLNRKHKNAYLLFSAITTFIAAIALYLALMINNLTLVIVCFGIFGVFSVTFLAPATAVIQNVVQPGMRAVAFGFNVLFMNFIGAFSFPIIIGKCSDLVGLHRSLFLLPSIMILAGILFMCCLKQYQHDKN
jgi:MFS family permease